jgi:hypothetical protein
MTRLGLRQRRQRVGELGKAGGSDEAVTDQGDRALERDLVAVGASLGCDYACSVGRTSISLTATRRGRVTMYSIASAMSSAWSFSTPANMSS